MSLAFASSLVTLLCQGCVSADAAGLRTSAPAAEPSLGITLAVPGAFGSGALNAPTGSQLAGPPLPVMTRVVAPTIRLTEPEAAVTVVVTQPEAGAFSLTGSGVAGESAPVDTGLSWGQSSALSSVAATLAASNYGQPAPEVIDMSIGLSLAATSVQTGLAFDVGLAPRLGVREAGDLSGRSLGGEVRVGQGLDLLGSGGTPEGWYVFVGTDGEALVWDADPARLGLNSLSDMQMTDQLTVGDLQAGVSVQRGGGELSLSYIRREVHFNDRNRAMSDSEDFAGITFTMRR